jgi:hypothetical protein
MEAEARKASGESNSTKGKRKLSMVTKQGQQENYRD